MFNWLSYPGAPSMAWLCTTLSKISRPKTQIYYLTVRRAESRHRCQWAKIKVWAGLHSFLEALGDNLFPCLFQLLEAFYIPPLTAPFLHFQNQQQQNESFSHWITLASFLSQNLALNLFSCFILWFLRPLMMTLGWPIQSQVIFLFYNQQIISFNSISNLKSPPHVTFTDSKI